MILEGLTAVDKNHWNFIVELATEIEVAVYINFVPGEASAAGQFREAFLHNFAEMASFSRIHNDAAGLRHARDSSFVGVGFPEGNLARSRNNVIVSPNNGAEVQGKVQACAL